MPSQSWCKCCGLAESLTGDLNAAGYCETCHEKQYSPLKVCPECGATVYLVYGPRRLCGPCDVAELDVCEDCGEDEDFCECGG